MINEYDRPVKGYKTADQYDHPATVIYDNFAPAENVFVETAIEEVALEEEPISEIVEEVTEEVNKEEMEGEE